MASLSQLPNEMISEIWGHILEPEDVESLALVSKQLYAIGRPFVEEHNSLKRNYSFFRISRVYLASSPAFLLRDILLRPRVALYVTHLSIDGYRFDWQDADDDDDDILNSKEWPRISHFPYPDDDVALFVETIRTASFVLQNEVENWITDMRAGDEDPILALLSLLLPHLTTITLEEEEYSMPERLQSTIERIAKAEKTTFLTRLTTVDLVVLADSSWMDLKWLRVFATLPQMQSIHVSHMGIEEDDYLIDEERYFMPGTSNITELTFTKSGLRPELLFQLLESIKGLKKFIYEEPDEGLARFEPFWIRVSLLVHAKHSLESLKVLSPYIAGDGIMGSLSEFTALKELETDYQLLIGWAGLDQTVDRLPASIEMVCLHIRDDKVHERLPLLVENIANAKSQLLPNLGVLELRLKPKMATMQRDNGLVQLLVDRCRDVGIDLKMVAT